MASGQTTASVLRRAFIALVCIIWTWVAFEQSVSAATAAPPDSVPPQEVSLSDLQLLLIGRLLWAFGEVEETDNDACQVSGPVHSLKWRLDPSADDNACWKWRDHIEELISSDKQLDDLDFSKTWDTLRNRALQDENASYRLCKREDGEHGEHESGERWCENAIKLYEPSARVGSLDAEFRLGSIYLSMPPGNGIDPADEGIMWLRRAAKDGYTQAQWELADAYWRRIAYYKPRQQSDYDEALEWLQRAAEDGHPNSQWQLGILYEGMLNQNGMGVPRDYVQAYKWLALSAQILSPNSPDNERILKAWPNHRKELAAKMTPQQITEAQRLAAEWLQRHAKAVQK